MLTQTPAFGQARQRHRFDLAPMQARQNGVRPSGRHAVVGKAQKTSPTDEAELLSALVGTIYDAALSPELWPDALRGASGFLPGLAASLFAKDASNKSLAIYYDDGGIDQHYVSLYMQTYGKIDPASTAHYFAEIGEPISTIDIAPLHEFHATRFFQEWAKPQGLIDFIASAIDKSATTVAMFGVFRHERDGVVDDEARRRMRLITPHVRRAVMIGRAIDLKAAQAATFTDAFDGLSASMVLVDASGRIVHANAAAHAMIESQTVLRIASGRLTTNNPESGKALRDAIDAAGKGDAALGTRGIALPITSRDGEHYVCHVLPLTSGERSRAGSVFAASAVLLIQKTALGTPAMPEMIAKTYKLTPAELRVLLAVAEVGGTSEVAEAFGISETTVKFHLKNLFEKTGARRQADLVRLLAGFSTPLAA